VNDTVEVVENLLQALDQIEFESGEGESSEVANHEIPGTALSTACLFPRWQLLADNR
jgi:hypothetical protein